MADPIATLITAYNELNPSIVDELHTLPTAVEFLRFVAKNRPFVVRGGANDWPAVRKWDAEYLLHAMEGRQLPSDGALVFVEPYETLESLAEFLAYVQEDTRLDLNGSLVSESSGRNVKYAQTQNNNLPNEYSPLHPDIPSDIPFATHALNRTPEATNLWIGNHRSTTAMHKDNYENIYVQVRGEKHFTLLPPICMPCVNEQMLPTGRYEPATLPSPENAVDPVEQSTCNLTIKMNDDGSCIPFAVWDPEVPEQRATPYSHLAPPVRVTLQEGDMLYLPAMWYHKVGQTAGREGFACAVNFWYDMEFDGGFWVQNSFLRDVVNGVRLDD